MTVRAYWGRAGAGLLLVARSTGRVLVALRSQHVREPGTLGVWGGKLEAGEAPLDAALAEFQEETGYDGSIDVEAKPLYVYNSTTPRFTYTTFLAFVPEEFVPRLNWETAAALWVTLEELLTLRPQWHYGLEALWRSRRARKRLTAAVATAA